jgi:hypothetical protein
MTTHITAEELKGARRSQHVAKLFGVRFLWIESFVFDTASSLSEQYDGGHWGYFTVSNGGFYMAPARGEPLCVACGNGFEGALSSEAFGITCCLYAYSMLSFSPDAAFAEKCADHFHRLRAFAGQHVEAKSILAAVD